MEEIQEASRAHHRPNEFVASFSENGDDLSQWRSYCPTGIGLSIGFASAVLEARWIFDPLSREPSLVSGCLAKIRYFSQNTPSELSSHIHSLVDSISETAASFDDDTLSVFDSADAKAQFLSYLETLDLKDLYLTYLQVMAPFFKHAAFQGEQEWRLLLAKSSGSMPGQQFRAGKSTIVPYVEAMLNLDSKAKMVTDYLITEVIVSPSPTPDLVIDALRALFISVGHPEVRVVSSSIPYRHW